MKKIISLFASIVMIMTTLLSFDFTVDAADSYSNNDLARACCHDPSIVKGDDGKYYVFGSHIASAVSDDLTNWYGTSSTMEGDGTKSLLSYGGKSWQENCSKALDWTTAYQLGDIFRDPEKPLEYNCWALDVIYNDAMNKWCMYACSSVWGTPGSVIFLAVSDTIDGPYKFVDTMIYSGFSSEVTKFNNGLFEAHNYKHTNVLDVLGSGFEKNIKNSKSGWFTEYGTYDCSYGKYPNCIDPAAFTDKSGNMWMSYGSFSGGIYVVPIDKETGLVDYQYMSDNANNGYDPYFGKQISKTCSDTEGTGEGPFIVYDSVSDYYYFYLTYGGLAGDGGYNMREYRSKSPDGPYYDKAGNKATDMVNTGIKLMGNYRFSCQPTGYLSGGHSSSLIDDDGRMYMAYHTRFTCDNGWGHQLRVHQMARTKDGWAVILPFEYQGESLDKSGYDASSLVGTYEFINHNNQTQRLEGDADLSTIMLPTQKIELGADGKLYGVREYQASITNTNLGAKNVIGYWSVENNTCYAGFTINSVEYQGVFCKQIDESASGNETMTFAAVGDNNATIWGVQIDNHTPNYTKSIKSATCTNSGDCTYTCEICGYEYTETIDKLPHNYITTKATLTKNGAVKCKDCGNVKSTIYALKTITLSTTNYTYDGKVKTPAVTVKDSKGKTLVKGTDYTVSYASGRKNVGKYAVKITFKGNYSGTKTLYFTIKPKNTSISGITAGSKKFTVKIKKYTTQTTGYQIQYAMNTKFTKAKTVTVGNKTTSKTISKLAAKKKYYVRIRTYKTVGGTKYYSDWSKYKAVTTK